VVAPYQILLFLVAIDDTRLAGGILREAQLDVDATITAGFPFLEVLCLSVPS
jgi:hypothetical protein